MFGQTNIGARLMAYINDYGRVPVCDIYGEPFFKVQSIYRIGSHGIDHMAQPWSILDGDPKDLYSRGALS